jgi:hypothetical protein
MSKSSVNALQLHTVIQIYNLFSVHKQVSWAIAIKTFWSKQLVQYLYRSGTVYGFLFQRSDPYPWAIVIKTFWRKQLVYKNIYIDKGPYTGFFRGRIRIYFFSKGRIRSKIVLIRNTFPHLQTVVVAAGVIELFKQLLHVGRRTARKRE